MFLLMLAPSLFRAFEIQDKNFGEYKDTTQCKGGHSCCVAVCINGQEMASPGRAILSKKFVAGDNLQPLLLLYLMRQHSIIV